ncbi:3-ketoacyl-ACP reductase [Psychrobacillus sp. NPDC093180]|uniref:3-ketoacyl-ACP reductase n=1 Tax=Psychrobacillus sp. NPDC093180 TaxID=3364489 RepID=UPI003821B771
MVQSLEGKVAFVTGAGRGIGKAIAMDLAKAGVNVGMLDKNEELLKKVASEIGTIGVKVAYGKADISSLEQVEQAIEKMTTEVGAADILINNAGIGIFGKLLDIEPEQWKKVIDVNLMGTYYVTRTVLPQMIEKNGGDVINISSTSGLSGESTLSAYSASKFGIIGLTESLAQEVRHNHIRVTALTPSTVVTDFIADLQLVDDDKAEQYMHPEDISQFIVSQLKLDQRIHVKTASLINTNPF